MLGVDDADEHIQFEKPVKYKGHKVVNKNHKFNAGWEGEKGKKKTQAAVTDNSDSSSAVCTYDGSGDLDDGTQDLLDGIIKLNDEGIKKLTELFGDNVQDAVDRIKAVKNASNDYQTFTEIAPSEDKDAVNTVKFVYRTAAVKAE